MQVRNDEETILFVLYVDGRGSTKTQSSGCTPGSKGNATLSTPAMMVAWPKGIRYSNFVLVLVSCTELVVTVKSNGLLWSAGKHSWAWGSAAALPRLGSSIISLREAVSTLARIKKVTKLSLTTVNIQVRSGRGPLQNLSSLCRYHKPPSRRCRLIRWCGVRLTVSAS